MPKRKMPLPEALEICERWFRYLDDQRAKTARMMKVNKDLHNGAITAREARREMVKEEFRRNTVYDGAKLEIAVRRLIEEVEKTPRA